MISLTIAIGSDSKWTATEHTEVEAPIAKLTPLKELAEMIKMDRSAARRYVLRLGFIPLRARTATSGYQTALVFTQAQVQQIVDARRTDGYC
jgi:hypothetical protein